MRLLDSLFGCSHRHLSFPITIRGVRHRNTAAALSGTYVVCLDCAKQFAYDWDEMKVVFETRRKAANLNPVARSAA